MKIIRKTLYKKLKIFVFHLKIVFIEKKIYFFNFEIAYILIDLNYIFMMKPSEFKTFILVESYVENLLKINKLLPCQKALSLQTVKDINYKFWMKIVSKFHAHIFYTFREISLQRALQSGRFGPGRVELGRFIILNDSASPKIVKKMYFNFFRFYFKV